VGVAALAVGQAAADRVVVVALHAQDAVLVQEREDAVGVRAEGAQVAEAVGGAGAAAADVAQGGTGGAGVVVGTAEDGNALGGGHGGNPVRDASQKRQSERFCEASLTGILCAKLRRPDNPWDRGEDTYPSPASRCSIFMGRL